MKNFDTVWDYEYWMKSNGMFVGLNTPEALKSEDFNHGLPPYARRKSFLVDEYPACPKNWMQSEGTLASYFVPVKEGNGMWLDFNKNYDHDYDVAIVISIQGVNPISGLPCKDEYLEQYIECCPKCETPFKPDRLCEKCNIRYPKQNYIATTTTPKGKLWLDGFRSLEGIVRQYILTAEKMRGVASNVKGVGSNRVFAIGVSFFLSKEKKPVYESSSSSSSWGFPCSSSSSSSIGSASSSSIPDAYEDDDDDYTYLDMDFESISSADNKSSESYKITCDNSDIHKVFSKKSRLSKPQRSAKPVTCNFIQQVKTKKLEVGAGANIDQQVYDDNEKIDFWRSEPEARICVNYVLEEDAVKIIEQGRRILEGHKEGFLQNVPVGN